MHDTIRHPPTARDLIREQLEALFPPAPRRLDGIEDYLWIGGDRMPAERAGVRLGVAARTVCRYRAAPRAAGITA